ncbi:MAG: T9SS type A sorting domain-containing protein [Chitinophagales bacterium]|nr:T9SS type A sorting domain-containing protein [Chitinophagales bacterium]
MKNTHTHFFLTALFALLLNSANAQITNNFSSDTESWLSICDGTGTAPAITYHATHGNPTGCIFGTDVPGGSGVWYFSAPSTYSGDLTDSYAWFLKFDIKQNAPGGAFNDEDVIIVKTDGTRIVYDCTSNPGSTYSSYSVQLKETGWRHNTIAGAAVSYATMQDYLGNVKNIYIRGDYSSSNSETAWLDNVKLESYPVMLPVELTAFNGTANDNTTQLDWTTATETNCLGFQIEKRTSNALVFDSIGYIGGNGTTTLTHHYTFTDNELYEKVYYRLKQMDIDGTISYSDVISLAPQNEIKKTIQIFPNPASNVIHITAEVGDHISGVELRDVNATLLYALNNQVENLSTVSIQVADFPAGSYYVIVATEKSNQTYPVLLFK